MSARARGGLDDHRADPTVARRVVALKAEDLVPSASRSGAGVRGRVAARRTLSAGAGRAAVARDPDVSHPRPRLAASRAGSQRHGVQLTCALPGHSW
jgi:hypothetical protein